MKNPPPVFSFDEGILPRDYQREIHILRLLRGSGYRPDEPLSHGYDTIFTKGTPEDRESEAKANAKADVYRNPIILLNKHEFTNHDDDRNLNFKNFQSALDEHLDPFWRRLATKIPFATQQFSYLSNTPFLKIFRDGPHINEAQSGRILSIQTTPDQLTLSIKRPVAGVSLDFFNTMDSNSTLTVGNPEGGSSGHVATCSATLILERVTDESGAKAARVAQTIFDMQLHEPRLVLFLLDNHSIELKKAKQFYREMLGAGILTEQQMFDHIAIAEAMISNPEINIKKFAQLSIDSMADKTKLKLNSQGGNRVVMWVFSALSLLAALTPLALSHVGLLGHALFSPEMIAVMAIFAVAALVAVAVSIMIPKRIYFLLRGTIPFFDIPFAQKSPVSPVSGPKPAKAQELVSRARAGSGSDDEDAHSYVSVTTCLGPSSEDANEISPDHILTQ